MVVVDAVLYEGRGVRSTPIARGENSGDGERDNISKLTATVPSRLRLVETSK